MSTSKRIAGLVGPTIVAMLISEFPLVQPHLYDAQIPPVVYLSGVLMFVAGLAIVSAQPLGARLDRTGNDDWMVFSSSRSGQNVCSRPLPTRLREHEHARLYGLRKHFARYGTHHDLQGIQPR